MPRALVIDDNRNNLEVLTLLLEREGVEPSAVLGVHQIDSALNAAKPFDVVFLDLEFPNADGFDVLQALKLDSRLNDVPIVAYSVHTSEIDRARRAGFDSFLGKPLDMARFPDQLRHILAGTPVWEV